MFKELLETMFDKNESIDKIQTNDNKNFLGWVIQKYNPQENFIRIKKNKQEKELKISDIYYIAFHYHSSKTFNDFICKRFFNKPFAELQGFLESEARNKSKNVSLTTMARTRSSKPTFIESSLDGTPVEAVMTYGTVTDIVVDHQYSVGKWYSTTSSQWASGKLDMRENRFYNEQRS